MLTVVGIVGILSLIAMPLYRDHTLKVKATNEFLIFNSLYKRLKLEYSVGDQASANKANTDLLLAMYCGSAPINVSTTGNVVQCSTDTLDVRIEIDNFWATIKHKFPSNYQKPFEKDYLTYWFNITSNSARAELIYVPVGVSYNNKFNIFIQENINNTVYDLKTNKRSKAVPTKTYCSSKWYLDHGPARMPFARIEACPYVKHEYNSVIIYENFYYDPNASYGG